jgi:glutamine amidotransferase-like uncharacterized protein
MITLSGAAVKGNMKKICVYADQGVDGLGLKQLIKNLKREGDLQQFFLERIDAHTLLTSSWEDSTDLLIIPGGRDLYYHAQLDGKGTDKIRSYVMNGGSYLGICAGAYFACDSIEFEKGGKLEVCGERSLKFFPGTARGPAYGPNRYSYENSQGVEAARVTWNKEECPIYFNGGCLFESGEDRAEVKVLSRYRDLAGQPPAIVEVAMGSGRVIISGVHLEYSVDFLDPSDPYLRPLIPLFAKWEFKRREIFRFILSQLMIDSAHNRRG